MPRLRPLNRALNQLIVHRQKVAQIGQHLGDGMAYKNGAVNAAANTPVFDMPLTSSLTNGVGTFNYFTRNDSDATVQDFEGIIRPVGHVDEARFFGARRVENLIASANPLDWSVQAQVQSIVPNGTYLGSPVWRVTTNTGLISVDLTDALAGKIAVGDTIRNSLYYKFVSGNFAGGNGLGLRTGNTNVTNIGTTGSTNTDWTRLAAAATSANTTTLNYGLTFLQASQIVFDICMMQSEDVSGQSNTAPSEYVSVGVGNVGGELQPNNDFSVDDTSALGTAGEWTWSGSVWSIQGGRAQQDVTSVTNLAGKEIEANKLYVVTYELGSDVSFNAPIAVAFGGVTVDIDGVVLPVTEGKHTRVVRSTGTGGLNIIPNVTGHDLWVDNVSVVELDHGSNVDGIKYFTSLNYNEVNSNVVTQGTLPANAGQQLLIDPEMDTDVAYNFTDSADFAVSPIGGSGGWEITGGKLKTRNDANWGTLTGKQTIVADTYYRVEYSLDYDSIPFTISLGSVLLTDFGTGPKDIIIKTSSTGTFTLIPSGSTSVVEIEYLRITPVVDIPEGILHGVMREEATINHFRWSQQFDAASTTWFEQGVIVPAYSPSLRSPDGKLHATPLTAQNLGGTSTAVQIYNADTIASNEVNAITVVAKKATLSWLSIETSGYTGGGNGNTFFDLAKGKVGTVAAPHGAKIRYIKDGWWACTITFSVLIDNVGFNRIRLASADGNNTVNLNGTDGIYLFSASCLGASQNDMTYVPTFGSLGQKNAEDIQYAMPATLKKASAPEGTIIAESNRSKYNGVTRYAVSLNDTVTGHAAVIGADVNAQQVALGFDGDVTSVTSVQLLNDGRFNMGTSWSPSQMTLYVNGVEDGNSPVVSPVLDPNFANGVLNIAGFLSATPLNGCVKNVKVYDKELGDANMQGLTA